MDLAARRTRDGVALGLHRQRSKEIVDLTTCVVLHPDLVALIPPLRRLLARLQGFRRAASVIANLLDSGPDVLLRTDGPLHLADRIALTEFARAHMLPRIAWAQGTDEPEPVAVLRPPTIALSGVEIIPPPGAFLQASSSGEAAIVAAVLAALPTAAYRGAVRRLWHHHLRAGEARTCRSLGRRCGCGIRPARRCRQDRPRGSH
jgi:23S rRNA (uracil1939-C5)-methyltransferase